MIKWAHFPALQWYLSNFEQKMVKKWKIKIPFVAISIRVGQNIHDSSFFFERRKKCMKSNLLRVVCARWISNRKYNTNWRMRKQKSIRWMPERTQMNGKFEPFRVSNEQQLKNENEKIIHCTRMWMWTTQHHCRTESNTILAPFGRSTWLCTITYNNNKNWSYRRWCCCVVVQFHLLQ